MATLFVSRGVDWLDRHGAQALVTPQNWLFLTSYRKLRETLLKRRTWNLVARLGPGAFETIGGHVVNVALSVLVRRWAVANLAHGRRRRFQVPYGECEGCTATLQAGIVATEQALQLKNPDARIAVAPPFRGTRLDEYALAPNGMHGGDSFRFRFFHWEIPSIDTTWRRFQTAMNETGHYGGRRHIFYWPDSGRIHEENPSAYVKGKAVWKKRGVVVRVVGELPVTLYTANYSTSVAFQSFRSCRNTCFRFGVSVRPQSTAKQYGASIRNSTSPMRRWLRCPSILLVGLRWPRTITQTAFQSPTPTIQLNGSFMVTRVGVSYGMRRSNTQFTVRNELMRPFFMWGSLGCWATVGRPNRIPIFEWRPTYVHG